MKPPKIESRITVFQSPWLRVTEKTVHFDKKEPEKYYSISVRDYVVVIAITPSRRIPIVRQYRPAVECTTEEFPAGLLDTGETPRSCAVRELFEETGLRAREVVELGTYFPDTGRLENRLHAFLVLTEESVPCPQEADLTVEMISVNELEERILTGQFQQQIHLGCYLLAILREPSWFK